MKHISANLPPAARSAKSTHSKPAPRSAMRSDPVVPLTTTARVKVDIVRQTDTNAIQQALGHYDAMTDHPTLPTPVPTQDVFKAAVDDLAAKKVVADAATAAAVQATADKNTARTLMNKYYTTRGSYVDANAGGDSRVIISAAMGVRATGTPTGNLPAPLNLSVLLNGTPGEAVLNWEQVAVARGYNIQFSLATTPDRHWDLVATVGVVGTATLPGLMLGQVYAFQVAAVGGASGQSPWSLEVTRMAA